MTDVSIPKTVTSFINGTWARASEGAHEIPVVYPGDERRVSTLIEADADEVDRAVRAARNAFDGGAWSKASVEDRKRVLLRIRDLVNAHADELAHCEVLHTGVPVSQVRRRHIMRSAMNFEFFAEFISQASAPVFDQNPDYLTWVRREPAGVAGLIAPWNAPLALASMKLAGAIAFGNSCVLKPSEMTPLSFVKLMDIIREAGVPDGVVNLVNGRGPVTGAALVDHPDVGVIAFTGGTTTGRQIGASAGGGLKKVVTELGGKSANIVFADADLERALDAALVAIFSNNGQQCLAGSRILLQRSIAEAFIEKFVARTRNLRIGDPFDPATEIGPLISADQRERVLGHAAAARDSADIDVLYGGNPWSGAQRGFFVEPTVVHAASNTLPVCQEEIFGPFATILTFDDFDAAMAIANDSEFGLVSYVWSTNMQTIMAATEFLRAGVVWINTPLTRELRAPFGGYKNSGVGRDGGEWSRALFTEEKTVTLPRREFPIAKLGATD
ncbi:MAG: aldehyde dehydrogenase [Gammaproteobacteria bacterium]|nr:aldehyde dehydrogenase [Gammaproteobacteria bacterium]MBT8444763.1 aldehyde dehydrogenase [Gammaproteobacteria bacterium]